MIRKSLGFATLLVSAVIAGPALAQAPADGSVLVKQRCQVCHSVAGKGGAVGPNLNGVVGRKAASTSYNYSAAMRKSGLTWNKATLDEYLAAPLKKVPGGKMPIGVPDAAQRAAIIAYLTTVK